MRPEAARAPGAAAAHDRELRELARLQRELQRAICGREAGGAGDAAAALGCEAEPIEVYRRMGLARFAREVAREFPATRALLGAARFDAEARAFALATTSRSYTLDGYARGFPEQLRRAGRAEGDVALGRAAELARLERECDLVRRARGRRGASSSGGQAAPRASGAPRLGAAAGARVRRFACDVETELARFERGESLRAPARRATHVALFQHRARARRLRLARTEAVLLAALLRGEALERAVARALGAGLRPAAIGRALERWVAAGLLAPDSDAAVGR